MRKTTERILTATGLAIAIAFAAAIVNDELVADSARKEARREAVRRIETGIENGTILPLEAVARRLVEAGYRHIWRMEYRGGKIRVKARDAEGRRLKLYLDPATGAILRTKYYDQPPAR